MSKINAKLLAEAIALIVQAVNGGDAGNDAGDESESSTEKRGRGRPAGSKNKAKDEKPAAAAKGKAKAKPEPEDEDEEEEEEEDGDDGLGLDEDEEEVTQEDVVAAFKALKASKGVEKCREVLAKLGESNVLNIPAKKYADAMKEINRAGSKK